MWTTLLIFFIILFTYIHLQHQLKTGEDMDIYEYEYESQKGLLEITQFKQPILFALDLPSTRENPYLDPMFVKDKRDYFKDTNRVDSISLTSRSARGLIDTDPNSLFYSDRNQTSIAESDIWKKWFESIDSYLQPAFTLYKECNVLYGSQKTQTIPVHYKESHSYLYLPRETNATHIRVKMTPYKSVATVSDYTYYEFWSKTNLFKTEVRCLDFMVKPGYILYVPPYWFYSIEFQDKVNEVCMVKYTTGANFLANAKHIGMYFMQQQNIQEKWWKQISDTTADAINNPADTINNPADIMTESTVELSQKIIPPLPDEISVAEQLVIELSKCRKCEEKTSGEDR
jgi:hypothetical protein